MVNMTNYTYLARDRTGRIARGELIADSANGLRTILHSQGMQLVSLEALPKPTEWLLSEISRRRWLPARSRDVEFALRQLAIMLRSGHALRGGGRRRQRRRHDDDHQ